MHWPRCVARQLSIYSLCHNWQCISFTQEFVHSSTQRTNWPRTASCVNAMARRTISGLSSCGEPVMDVILKLSKSCMETTLLRILALSASWSFVATMGHKLRILGIKPVFSAANACWMDVFSLNLSNSYNRLVVSIIAFAATLHFWQRFVGQFWFPVVRCDSSPVVFSDQSRRLRFGLTPGRS